MHSHRRRSGGALMAGGAGWVHGDRGQLPGWPRCGAHQPHVAWLPCCMPSPCPVPPRCRSRRCLQPLQPGPTTLQRSGSSRKGRAPLFGARSLPPSRRGSTRGRLRGSSGRRTLQVGGGAGLQAGGKGIEGRRERGADDFVHARHCWRGALLPCGRPVATCFGLLPPRRCGCRLGRPVCRWDAGRRRVGARVCQRPGQHRWAGSGPRCAVGGIVARSARMHGRRAAEVW